MLSIIQKLRKNKIIKQAIRKPTYFSIGLAHSFPLQWQADCLSGLLEIKVQTQGAFFRVVSTEKRGENSKGHSH
jgi:hypothetical protein